MANLVCEQCGGDDFKQTRYAVIEYGVRFDESVGEFDTGREECLDGGDRDQEIVCDDCGAEVMFGYRDEHDGLVTQEQYDGEECD